ncbi:TDP-N-acetylfucosamine:lipid II N-acetylfucosaminyltransferase [Algoriphagus sp. C2-6-M1]|uniref:TDP-N-acetylfucosamine:lipid II N-acetylfucosaminyltransferase n=1 Tax=Algoriphagus persicinus TaxID=3108754 RepID=UPI002B3CFBF3|nr:TDP-N-acetylfucosamine:lipid II N-acetylfucosaminyltransferase [Algoriphagus sp. C2-6-M1]MEB2779631.1 TDP-N-acetylfucosamine:lipid II N-acetylfucosaminyltransferase [Algoriphagus sp. C2-6-M1]
MSIENLVFLPDSPYTEWIINRSEELFPGLNKYLVVVEDVTKPTRFTNPEILVIENGNLENNPVVSELASFKRVIVNYHTPFIGHFLNRRKSELSHAKLIWIIWSGDLYKHPSFLSKAYTRRTMEVLPPEKIVQAWKKSLHHRILQALGKPNKYSFNKSFSNFDFVASIFEKDVMEAESVLGVKAKWIRFAFLSLQEMFSEEYLKNKPVLGSKIMVGHSGSPENNHLDVYHQIHSLLPENKVTILSPLSYGNQTYIAAVKAMGENYFGDKYETLDDFIPREIYYHKLAEASVAIFNHKIQQAFGNILGLIFMGVKVFLNPENPVFIELNSHNIKVFDYAKMTQDDLLNPLSAEDVDTNRAIIGLLFKEEKIRDYYRDLYIV